jgi:hypothetical protein
MAERLSEKGTKRWELNFLPQNMGIRRREGAEVGNWDGDFSTANYANYANKRRGKR